jgi:hypothetical protein
MICGFKLQTRGSRGYKLKTAYPSLQTRGREGFGLPAGLVPVNGAGGVSNTWILHDFYNYGK